MWGGFWGKVGHNLPELHILPSVGLIRLLHVGEFKVEGLRLGNFSRPGQVLHQGHKFMVVPTVVVEFWRESISLLYQTPNYMGPSEGPQAAGAPFLKDLPPRDLVFDSLSFAPSLHSSYTGLPLPPSFPNSLLFYREILWPSIILLQDIRRTP